MTRPFLSREARFIEGPARRFIEGPVCRRARPALVSQRSEVLEALAFADADIAVWRRTLPADLSATLETWARSGASPCDAPFYAGASDLSRWLYGLDDAAARAWLEQDIHDLVKRFVRALDVEAVRLVLGVVSDDKCRKFHVDNLRMRMICTYVGPGTEWVDDPWVRREALTYDVSGAAKNQDIVRNLDRVERANAGDVLWVRGKAWRSGPFGGVHRSPPLAGSGRVRLLLVASAMGR
jgi:hypothetical protein